jgi:hypothetical protein
VARTPGTCTRCPRYPVLPRSPASCLQRRYEWKIAAGATENGIIATGAFTNIVAFTTPASFATTGTGQTDAVKIIPNDESQLIRTVPNPASSSFKIQFVSTINGTANAILTDMNGKTAWSSGPVSISSLNGRLVSTNQIKSGIYYLRIMNEDGKLNATTKVIIAK